MLSGSFLKQGFFNRPRFMTWVAALLCVVLAIHSLDVCASHTGIPRIGLTAQVLTVTHNGAQCSARPGVACLCADCVCVPFPLDSDSHEKDGCESTSELATRAQVVNFQLDAPLIDVPVVASLRDANAAPATLIAFLGSDGPPLARLRSQFLTSPCSGRAPPISA